MLDWAGYSTTTQHVNIDDHMSAYTPTPLPCTHPPTISLEHFVGHPQGGHQKARHHKRFDEEEMYVQPPAPQTTYIQSGVCQQKDLRQQVRRIMSVYGHLEPGSDRSMCGKVHLKPSLQVLQHKHAQRVEKRDHGPAQSIDAREEADGMDKEEAREHKADTKDCQCVHT